MNNTFPVFNDEQLSLLKRLLTKAVKAKASPSKKSRKKKKKRLVPVDKNAQASRPILVKNQHTEAASRSDFSWVPKEQSDAIEFKSHMLIPTTPAADQLVTVGHIYWSSSRHADQGESDTIITGNRLRRVIFRKVDPAIEHIFKTTRLAWIALISNGLATDWEPVLLRITAPSGQLKTRHLHLRSINKQYRAINEALRSGVLCVSVKATERVKAIEPSRVPKPVKSAKHSSMPEPIKPTHPKQRKQRVTHFPLGNRSGTNFDGSALISSPPNPKFHRGKNPLVKGEAVTTPRRVMIGTQVCSRCSGGELPNCPLCDGAGFITLYEGEPTKTSSVSMFPDTHNAPNSSLGATLYPGASANTLSDHEAVHRTDLGDANRHASGIFRENGRFGSMPLYENYDD